MNRRDRARVVLRFVHGLLSNTAGAMFIGTRGALSPSTAGFPIQVYLPVQQATIRNLLPVMGWLLGGSVASGTATIALDRDLRRAALTAVAVAAQISTGALTQQVNMPINRQVLRWTPDTAPADWAVQRDRWERTHTVRAALALLAQAALLGAALLERPPLEPAAPDDRTAS